MVSITVKSNLKTIDQLSSSVRYFRAGVTKRFKPKLPKLAGLIETRSRFFAPVDTGRLQKKLTARAVDNRILIHSGAPYAKFQEEGFRAHYIPKAYLNLSRQGLDTHGLSINNPVGGYVLVKKFTPHIRPALQQTREEIAEAGLKAAVEQIG